MDQKIYKDKHPSDFTVGSIIKIIGNSTGISDGKLYLIVEGAKDKYGNNIYAVLLNNIYSFNAGQYYTSSSYFTDFELIRGSLK